MANDQLAACSVCGPQFRDQLYEVDQLSQISGKHYFHVGCQHCGHRETSTCDAAYARQRWNRKQERRA